MKTLPVNTTDQSATIQSAINAGETSFLFSPGLHRIGKKLSNLRGRIIGYGATIDLRMAGWACDTVNAPLVIEGARIIGRKDAPLTLATGNGGSIEFINCDVDVETTTQNIGTVGATGSTFRSKSAWNNATVTGCEFTANCYIGGATKFTDNNLRNARLLAHYLVGNGLKGALVRDCHWFNGAGLRNEHESLMFEDCNVTDSVFENLWFHGCIGPVVQYWGWSSGSMTGCKFARIISTGPSHAGITLVALNGVVDGNTFDEVIINDTMFPVIAGKGCVGNSFTGIYVNGCRPWIHHAGFWTLDHDWAAMWRDGVQAFPWEAKDMTDPANLTIFSDYGTGTKWNHVRISGSNGAAATNRPERFNDLVIKG